MLRGGFRSGTPVAGASSSMHGSPVLAPVGDNAPVLGLSLHRAVSTGNVALVLFALEHGQSANSVLHGITPLHVAACLGEVSIVQLLMAYGAEVNQPKTRARTAGGPGVEGSLPLHFAAANGHYEIVRLLLEHGSRPLAQDRDGQSPEALALANQQAECASLVRAWAQAYGTEGHTDSATVRHTQHVMGPHSDALSMWTLSPSQLPAAPSLSRPGTAQSLRVMSPNTGVTDCASIPPLSLQTDMPMAESPSETLSPQPSRTPISPIPDTRRLSSLFEMASHPASSLRAALWPGTRSADTDADAPSTSLRLPRISSRASLAGLFKRQPSVSEELSNDSSSTSQRSPAHAPSSSALFSLVDRRSELHSGGASEATSPSHTRMPDVNGALKQRASRSENLSTTRARASSLSKGETPPSTPMRPAMGTPSSKWRMRLSGSHTSPPESDGNSLNPPLHALPATSISRLRSNSASSGRATRDGHILPLPSTRSRATSDVQTSSETPSLEGVLNRTLPGDLRHTTISPETPSGALSDSRSLSGGSAVSPISVTGRGETLLRESSQASPPQGPSEAHSELAMFLARIGQT